ncbi:MAG: amino acid ABC transporter substrate-binding protein [Caldilineaceae bacterium]|nr:amino acid ABC transporter substrate-binding protein [Caldilineaceae bacterium]
MMRGQTKLGSRRRLWLAGGALLLLIVGLVALMPNNPITRLLRQDTTWRTMEQRGTWRVGMDPSFPPFEQLDDQGQPVGLDVDLARAMAAEWGLEVEIVAIGFDSLIDALQAGKVDSIVSALPYDERLTGDIAYSRPYFEAGVRLAARSDTDLAHQQAAVQNGAVTGAAAERDAQAVLDGTVLDGTVLVGHTLAVEWGSMGDMVGRRLQREGIDLALRQFPTPQEAVDALTAGQADTLLIDNVTLRQAQGQGAPIVAVGPALDGNPYVIAMPLQAHDLHAAVDDAFAALQETGALAELEAIWFGPLPADPSP